MIPRKNMNNVEEKEEQDEEQDEPEYSMNEIRQTINELTETIDLHYNTNTNTNTNTITKKKQNNYIYLGVDALNTQLDELKFYNGQQIYVCAYQVNTESSVPFLQYFMNKWKETLEDNIKFPSFQYDATKITNTDNIMKICNTILDIFYICYDAKDDVYGCFKGYKKYKNNIYLFFDCSLYKISSHYLYKRNDLWLTLIDEIVNHKSVCNFKIDDLVIDFFMDNTDFLYLMDADTGYNYPMPICVFNANYNHMVEFSLQFGQAPESLLDNYYIFTDYDNSFELAKTIQTNKQHALNKAVKMGIIRFAIFSERHIKILDDDEYNNFMSLSKTNKSYYYWDNEKPYWIIKDYKDQIALSAHFVNIANRQLL